MNGMRLAALASIGIFCAVSRGLQPDRSVEFSGAAENIALVRGGKAAVIITDANDYVGVLHAVGNFREDVHRVSGIEPLLAKDLSGATSSALIVGTLHHSAVIDRLVAEKKIDVSALGGRWETYSLQIVDHPTSEIDRAAVIVGSDKRGTIYGVYDLSEQIGVSPWYWWADVPVTHHDDVSIRRGAPIVNGPVVKYRGIFLNDEAPSLSGWTKEKFGGYNHEFYEHVFELLLRLKGNYLWPAMWNNAFNEDDPRNAQLADEDGIIMGTSHHEPMLRAQQEWKRHGTGPWDYATNGPELRKFWTEGVRRNRDFESITTIGMRGDGDLPMSEESNVALLEGIVADQRKILQENVNPDVTKIPQVWALYKEVQGYYEKGMRVPDDVTLLWCDDNWGNLRRLPTPAERARSGGAGVYYHFDYVGGPRNYKWINVTPIPKVWEQMDLAAQYGADRLWIVNVGDLKPMEFPIEFFLTMAWNPRAWPAEKLSQYTVAWAARQFGAEHAEEIAGLIARYTKYNGRRKPELLSPDTYSLINYREDERIVAEFSALSDEAKRIEGMLPPEARDAYFELVLHPVEAARIVNELYIAAGKNHLFARQGRVSSNEWGEKARFLFADDARLSERYNLDLKSGKWNHMMDQTHLGYTGWQQPPNNSLPSLATVRSENRQEWGIAIEGISDAWTAQSAVSAVAVLPSLDNVIGGTRWIDLFRRADQPVEFRIEVQEPWLHVFPRVGTIGQDLRATVSVDWSKVPEGEHQGHLSVLASGRSLPIILPIRNRRPMLVKLPNAFVEEDGFISIEAASFDRAVETDEVRWRTLPDFGRTVSAVTTQPGTFAPLSVASTSPHLEYNVYTYSASPLAVKLDFAPTQAFQPGRGLRCAVSMDGEKPELIEISPENNQAWEQEVMDSIRHVAWQHAPIKLGEHVLRIWAVDPGVVLEKIILDFGGLRPSYLGPPESRRAFRAD